MPKQIQNLLFALYRAYARTYSYLGKNFLKIPDPDTFAFVKETISRLV